MLCIYCYLRIRHLHSFPTRRSSDLMRALADAPETILQLLVDHTLVHCRAGSAGISILEDDQFFRWHAVAGRWAHLVNGGMPRSEEHTSELQSRFDLVCRLLLEKINH